MSIRNSILAFAMVMSTSAFAASYSCHMPPQPIGKATKEDIAGIAAAMKASKTDGMPERSELVDEYRISIADVNNDGQPEYVVFDHEGSGSFLSLYFFKKTKKGFEEMADMPRPAEFTNTDGGWYSHDCYNSAKKSNETVVNICGTVYFNFDGNETGACDAYVWKDGKTTRVCNDDWAIFQTGEFQALYDTKNYDEAINNLQGFYAACKSQLTDETKLNILSNLSIALAHTSDTKNCLADVKEAKALPGFAKSKSKSSLLQNEEMCKSIADAPTLDFKSAEEVKSAGVTDKLLSSTIPNIEFDRKNFVSRAQKWFDAGVIGKNDFPAAHRYNIRDEVRRDILSGEATIESSAIISIAGCRAHDCGDKGFVWVNTEEKVSVFAINSLPFPINAPGCDLTIGSRTVNSSNLPVEFWNSFKTWAKNATQAKCAYFVDGTKPEPHIQRIDLR